MVYFYFFLFFFIIIFFLPFEFIFLLLGFSFLRYLFTLFANARFRPVIEFSYAIQEKLLVRQWIFLQ